MDIPYLIKDFIACRGNVQQFINNRFHDDNCVIVDKTKIFNKKIFKYFVSSDGTKYIPHPENRAVGECCYYDTTDINADGVVLDIGANVGCFSIPASRISNHVFAVEPIRVMELIENVALNKSSVTVIEGALGDGDEYTLKWENSSKTIRTFTLKHLITLCGGRVDFLKCDCEGYEWLINPDDFEGIRRIEMELHYPPHAQQEPNEKIIDYLRNHYEVVIEDGDKKGLKILHARLTK
jgi:hypothetical protein